MLIIALLISENHDFMQVSPYRSMYIAQGSANSSPTVLPNGTFSNRYFNVHIKNCKSIAAHRQCR